MSSMSRRHLMFAATGIVAVAATPRIVFAQAAAPAPAAAAPAGPFTLPPLNYALNVFEPHIDAKTMEIHHTKHHQAYITNLNNALMKHADLHKLSLAQLVSSPAGVPDDIKMAVRNNAGGHINHTMFWQLMAKKGGGEPKGMVGKAIDAKFGSFDKFQDAFTKAALARFGSGWAWLIVQKGELVITSTPNQDTPLMRTVDGITQGRPILGLDVWEHAYYLKYQNRRPDYIKAWWNVVNWEEVAERFAARTN